MPMTTYLQTRSGCQTNKRQKSMVATPGGTLILSFSSLVCIFRVWSKQGFQSDDSITFVSSLIFLLFCVILAYFIICNTPLELNADRHNLSHFSFYNGMCSQTETCAYPHCVTILAKVVFASFEIINNNCFISLFMTYNASSWEDYHLGPPF